MKTPEWYVITGGPSSGKTILLKKLGELGYHTVPEAARILLEEYIKKGISPQEARKDDKVFERSVLEKKLKDEGEAPRNAVVFFDRGVPDSITYFKIAGLQTQEVEKLSKNRYKKIFFLEQVPFQPDYARIEDEKTAEKISQLLVESYKNTGYEIVFIPAVSVEERVKLVLSNL